MGDEETWGADWEENEDDLLLEPLNLLDGKKRKKKSKFLSSSFSPSSSSSTSSREGCFCCGCCKCCVRRFSRGCRRICCTIGLLALMGFLVAIVIWTQYPLFSSCAAIPTFVVPLNNTANVSDIVFTPTGLRVNHVTVAGTHNSYHRRSWLAWAVHMWAYSYPTYSEQLAAGVRAFEVDFHYSKGIFSVFHLPFLDFRSNARCVSDILTDMRLFSDANPCHFPISISFEPKYEIDYDQYCKHVDGGRILYRFQELITSIIPRERIITPADIMRGGNFSTLREAIVTRGWPDLASAKGMFLLNLNLDIYSSDCRKVYDAIPVDKQLLFPRRLYTEAMVPGHIKGDASMVELYEPWTHAKEVAELARNNFYIRGYVGNAENSKGTAVDHIMSGLNAGMHVLATDDYYRSFVPKGVLCNRVHTLPDCEEQLAGLNFESCNTTTTVL